MQKTNLDKIIILALISYLPIILFAQTLAPPTLKTWKKCVDGNYMDTQCFIITNNLVLEGGYIILGGCYLHAGDNEQIGYHDLWDLWLVKRDKKGEFIWQTMISKTNHDYSFELSEIPGNTGDAAGFMLRGWEDPTKCGEKHEALKEWFVKIDSLGKIYERTNTLE